MVLIALYKNASGAPPINMNSIGAITPSEVFSATVENNQPFSLGPERIEPDVYILSFGETKQAIYLTNREVTIKGFYDSRNPGSSSLSFTGIDEFMELSKWVPTDLDPQKRTVKPEAKEQLEGNMYSALAYLADMTQYEANKMVLEWIPEKSRNTASAKWLAHRVDSLGKFAVGAQAYDFEFVDTEGKKVRLSDFRGRLVLVDLVCHGVASPYLWRDYLRYLEHVHGAELVAVDFRDKRFGWHSHRESFRFKDGRCIYPDFTVYRDCFLRPSCGNCPFTNLKHPADITIGDFWGIEKTELRAKDDNKGFSLLLCHTDKGEAVFERSRKHLEVYSMKPEACLQPNLLEPTRLPCSHRLIGKFYHRTGLCLFLTIRPVLCLIKRVIQRIKRAFL